MKIVAPPRQTPVSIRSPGYAVVEDRLDAHSQIGQPLQPDHRVRPRRPVAALGASLLVDVVVDPVGQAPHHQVEIQIVLQRSWHGPPRDTSTRSMNGCSVGLRMGLSARQDLDHEGLEGTRKCHETDGSDYDRPGYAVSVARRPLMFRRHRLAVARAFGEHARHSRCASSHGRRVPWPAPPGCAG